MTKSRIASIKAVRDWWNRVEATGSTRDAGPMPDPRNPLSWQPPPRGEGSTFDDLFENMGIAR